MHFKVNALPGANDDAIDCNGTHDLTLDHINWGAANLLDDRSQPDPALAHRPLLLLQTDQLKRRQYRVDRYAGYRRTVR